MIDLTKYTESELQELQKRTDATVQSFIPDVPGVVANQTFSRLCFVYAICLHGGYDMMEAGTKAILVMDDYVNEYNPTESGRLQLELSVIALTQIRGEELTKALIQDVENFVNPDSIAATPEGRAFVEENRDWADGVLSFVQERYLARNPDDTDYKGSIRESVLAGTILLLAHGVDPDTAANRSVESTAVEFNIPRGHPAMTLEILYLATGAPLSFLQEVADELRNSPVF